MAVSKISDWLQIYKLGERHALMINWGVYADMDNGNTQPYLRAENWLIHTLSNHVSLMSVYAPFTFKIQINDEAKTYTFKSGDSFQHKSADVTDEDTGDTIGYYYLKFSNSTNIMIPKDGEEFVIHITVTDRAGRTYTFHEEEAAPISTRLVGSSNVTTGTTAVYSLSRAMVTNSRFTTSAEMSYYMASSNRFGGSEGYTGQYLKASDRQSAFSEIRFLPLSAGGQPGERNSNDQHVQDHIIVLKCEYKVIADAVFTDDYQYYGYGGQSNQVKIYWKQPKTHIITNAYRDVTVTVGTQLDQSLRPEFRGIRYDDYYQRQLERYGAAVQGHSKYWFVAQYQARADVTHGDTLQYGSKFVVYKRRDYTSGTLLETQEAVYGAALTPKTVVLNHVVTNAPYEVEGIDTIGFTTSYTDYVTVLPYHDPLMPVYSARRCSPVTGGSDETLYPYNGVAYRLDDYGEYALIEWSVDFSPLQNVNGIAATVSVPSQSATSGYESVTLNLTDYVCSGYLVVPADIERSYDVTFTLTDDFHGPRAPQYVDSTVDGFFSPAMVYVAPLNTASAMIDFRRGGTGVAFGKVSEIEKYVDIHRNWLLRMPYSTKVRNYRTDGYPIVLRDWMQTCLDRIQAITDAKPWGIYGERYGIGHAWFDGYTPLLIPDGYGEVYTGGNYRCMSVVPNRDKFVGVTHIEPFTVNRNYLNIRFDTSYSFRGQGFHTVTYRPMIYLCSTKPTSIDQATGEPNATIVDSQQITTAYSVVGGDDDGYSYWDCSRGYYVGPDLTPGGFEAGVLHSFNVASRKGQQLWVVITCRQGGQSQSGYYKHTISQLNVYDIVLSNQRANFDRYFA